MAGPDAASRALDRWLAVFGDDEGLIAWLGLTLAYRQIDIQPETAARWRAAIRRAPRGEHAIVVTRVLLQPEDERASLDPILARDVARVAMGSEEPRLAGRQVAIEARSGVTPRRPS